MTKKRNKNNYDFLSYREKLLIVVYRMICDKNKDLVLKLAKNCLDDEFEKMEKEKKRKEVKNEQTKKSDREDYRA